jgi:hypothetical protein
MITKQSLVAHRARRRPPMRESSDPPRWTRHFFYRTEHTRTTWKLRIGLVLIVLMTFWLTGGWWTAAMARSLECESSRAPSDTILIENFDPDYVLFERARHLRDAGLATRVLIPVPADPDTAQPRPVELAMTEMLARLARLGSFDVVPYREAEPISLTEARDLVRYVQREQIHSVIVVSPMFRSRRSALVYEATLGRAGIVVRCEPVEGTRDADTWTRSEHGIQDVGEQWIKLQYYRLYVLPFKNRRAGTGLSPQ